MTEALDDLKPNEIYIATGAHNSLVLLVGFATLNAAFFPAVKTRQRTPATRLKKR